jgi:hypothetical protein
MMLRDYLEGMRSAATALELEAAIQAPFKHSFRGRTWTTICKARIEAGQRICAAHSLGQYVPRLGPHRRLSICGETYKVGVGHNSTGVRYCWHYAGEWAKRLLVGRGFSVRAANRIWGGWHDYPHRTLVVIEDALAGKIPDPELNVLTRHEHPKSRPLNYTVKANDADDGDRRATRSCACGGTLFDWGAGYSEGFVFVNWHCNGCPDVFTEYMTNEHLSQLRAPSRAARLAA